MLLTIEHGLLPRRRYWLMGSHTLVSSTTTFSTVTEDTELEIQGKNISKEKPTNLLKRISTFFIDEKINETHVHPKISSKKEILENNETQIDEDQIQQTISKDSDLFSIEKQNKFTDHQIDLIDMDQQNQDIDEDVLEIPAFLRRQAN